MINSSTVANLASTISSVWPTIEGAERVPPLPMIVYQIAETLKQDMCVLVMDEIDPDWELKVKESIDNVMELLMSEGSEGEDTHHTFH